MIKVLKRTFEFILVFQIFGHLISWSIFVIMFATQQPTYPLINVELLTIGGSILAALIVCACCAPLVFDLP